MFGSLFGSSLKTTMVSPERALSGRPDPVYTVPETHAVLGTPLAGPWPEGTRVVYLGLGCFWGAEKEFWQLPGVVTTAAGYQGGFTPHPTYEEVCTALTGHTEAVMVAYDPTVVSDVDLLRTFWESHDPTQGFRQGNDVGTQYRSAVYWTTPEQEAATRGTLEVFQASLTERGFGQITTDLRSAEDAGPFYYAEAYHQQYLHKNPNGYCPVHSTGVACSVPSA
ncbi:peptide-methionine (S)-S-oxide reductase MsrA [Sanguibacter suaedae]|uniref:Peptide methionine sulfoxide reductase MsrA n=1 Tax=Sanguibacter suaedae TaxID=2795737 RepID=A0A934I3S8_9MICO|nr:peptide-methionine (S)-S-oxide reductase MsrA [Sanguibacter suaedae]MBI9114708.1 peptide-methionine (S)-S-oxide reductase MsrA [Sanguibacter suaedae]